MAAAQLAAVLSAGAPSVVVQLAEALWEAVRLVAAQLAGEMVEVTEMALALVAPTDRLDPLALLVEAEAAVVVPVCRNYRFGL